MAMLILASGVVYIHAQEQKNEVANQNSKYKAGTIELGKLLEMHPDTQDIYQKYQEKLTQIKENNSEDTETQIEQLNQEYISLVKNSIQNDLDQFVKEFGLDVLLVNNKIISGNQNISPEELTNVQDVSSYFMSYLNKVK